MTTEDEPTTEGDFTSFGEVLSGIREKRGLSLKALEEATRDEETGNPAITSSGLLLIENGTRINPKMKTLSALCRALDMRVVIDSEGVYVEDMLEERFGPTPGR